MTESDKAVEQVHAADPVDPVEPVAEGEDAAAVDPADDSAD